MSLSAVFTAAADVVVPVSVTCSVGHPDSLQLFLQQHSQTVREVWVLSDEARGWNQLEIWLDLIYSYIYLYLFRISFRIRRVWQELLHWCISIHQHHQSAALGVSELLLQSDHLAAVLTFSPNVVELNARTHALGQTRLLLHYACFTTAAQRKKQLSWISLWLCEQMQRNSSRGRNLQKVYFFPVLIGTVCIISSFFKNKVQISW